MELRTERLLLREMRPDDLEAFLEMDAHPQSRTYETPRDEAAIRKVMERTMAGAAETPRRTYWFVVTIPPSDRMRGRAGVALSHPEYREWEIGWQMHVEEWGKGYATEAGRELLRLAFHELNAHRVVAFCHAQNRPSERVMQKLGMQQEGRTRETFWWRDHWVDELMYAILEREFLAGQPFAG